MGNSRKTFCEHYGDKAREDELKAAARRVLDAPGRPGPENPVIAVGFAEKPPKTADLARPNQTGPADSIFSWKLFQQQIQVMPNLKNLGIKTIESGFMHHQIISAAKRLGVGLLGCRLQENGVPVSGQSSDDELLNPANWLGMFLDDAQRRVTLNFSVPGCTTARNVEVRNSLNHSTLKHL